VSTRGPSKAFKEFEQVFQGAWNINVQKGYRESGTMKSITKAALSHAC
jgi:hypothetical protein